MQPDPGADEPRPPGRPGPSTTVPWFRPIEPTDIDVCIDIFDAAQQELAGRLSQPWSPADRPIMGRLLAHLIEGNRGCAWIAEAGDGAPASRGPLAFAVAIRRGSLWFLSFLFVRPEAQGAGLGRRLLLRCLAEGQKAIDRPIPTDAEVFLATCVDALQPVSTGLYAGYGIVPRTPLLTMVGRPVAGSLPQLPSSVTATPFEEVGEAEAGHDVLVRAIERLDRQLVGYERPTDHRFWRRDGRIGVLYRGPKAEGLAYGYVARSGRLGPICVRDTALAPAVLGDLFGRVEPAGAYQVVVPGAAERALVSLLHAGLRFEGSPALYCASRSATDFERYLPAGFALL